MRWATAAFLAAVVLWGQLGNGGKIEKLTSGNTVSLATSADPGVAGLGDVDSDGDVDVAYCTSASKIGIRSISSGGDFASSHVEITLPNDGSSSAPSCTAIESVGDLDCDGKPDLVVLHNGGLSSKRVTGHSLDMSASTKISSTAIFSVRLDSPSNSDSCTHLFTSDFSNDGLLDVLVSCANRAAWTVVLERDPSTGCRSAGTTIAIHAARFPVIGTAQWVSGLTAEAGGDVTVGDYSISPMFPALPDALDGVGNFMVASHDKDGSDPHKRGGMIFVINVAPALVDATWCDSNCNGEKAFIPDTSADPPVTCTTATTLLLNNPLTSGSLDFTKSGLGRCVGGGVGPNGGAVAMLGVDGELGDTIFAAPMGSGGGPGSTTSIGISPASGQVFKFVGDIDGNGVTDMVVGSGSNHQTVLLKTSGNPLPFITAAVEPGYECCYPTKGGAATPGSKKLRIRVTLPSPTAVTLWTPTTTIGPTQSACTSPSWVAGLSPAHTFARTGVYECTTPALTGSGLVVTVSMARVGVSNAMASVTAGVIDSEGPLATGWASEAAASDRIGGSSWELTVSGRNFGSSAVGQVILVAGIPCEEYDTSPDPQTTIICSRPPACVGKGFNVSVSISGVEVPVPGPLLDFAPPAVTSVQIAGAASEATQLPTAALDAVGGQGLYIQGTGFGGWNLAGGFRSPARTCQPDPTATIPDSLAFAASIRGVPCVAMAWFSATKVQCTTPPGTGTSPPLVVAVMGQSVTVDTSSLLSAPIRFSPPIITRLSQTSNLDVGGTTKLLVSGTGFGVPGFVSSLSVTVGGLQCVSPGEEGHSLTKSGHIAATAIECIAPSLVGSNLAVVVTADGQSSTNNPSDNARVSYAQPTLTAVDPAELLTYPAATAAQNALTLVVTGTNLGRSSSDLRNLSIAGKPCPGASLHWISSTRIECRDLELRVGTFPDRTVDVTLSGGASNADRGLGLLTVADQPRVLSVESGATGPVDGSTLVELLVEDAGFVTADVVSVRAGPGARCESHALKTTSAGQTLTCTITGGTGAGLPFSFTTRTGVTSVGSSARFTFDPPVVTALQFPGQPANAKPVLMAGQTYTDVVVSGTSLGIRGRFEPNVSIAGVPCTSFALINGTAGICGRLEAPSPSGIWPSRTLVLTSSPSATFKDDLAVVTLGAPEIFDVSPRQADTSGGTTLEIVGVNLGTSATQVLNLKLGGKPCPLVDAVPSDTGKLRCRVPAGTGQGLSVELQSSTGLVATSAGLFSYSPVTVTSVTPALALAGPANLSFVIAGSSLGNSVGDVTGASVGGVPCGKATRISASSIQCDGVWAGNGWTSTQAVVRVYDTDVSAANVFTGVQLPAVRSVSPSAVSTTGLADGSTNADTLTVIGSALLSIVRVTVGPDARECTDIAAVGFSGEEITCKPPPGTGTGLTITVVNALGGKSIPQRLVSYRRPAVTSMTPDRFLAPGTAYAGVDVTIKGDHFGSDISKVDRVVIGGTDCETIALPAPSRRSLTVDANASSAIDIACKSFTGTLLDDNVVVVVNGQQSDAKPLIRTRFSAPLITAVVPPTLTGSSGGAGLDSVPVPQGALASTPRGPRDVDITGSGFGWERAHITQAFVGTVAATVLAVETDTAASSTGTVRIRVPESTGVQAPIRLVSVAGPSATFPFGFAPPQVFRTAPGVILPTGSSGAASLVNVTITGDSLGHSREAVAWLKVGGVACGGVEWRNASQIVCTDLDASGDWLEAGVAIGLRQAATPTVQGASPLTISTSFTVSTDLSGNGVLFPLLTLPRIDSVTTDGEASVAGGWNISILDRAGTGFGRSRADIASVQVGALAIPPGNIHVPSVGKIVATMPAGSGSNLPVTVTTVAGASVTGGSVSYDRAVVSGLVPTAQEAQLRSFAFAGDTSPITIGIAGSSLASAAAGIDRVEICGDAGSPCAPSNPHRVACRMQSSPPSSSGSGVLDSGELAFVSSDRLTCTGLRLPSSFPAGRATVAVFTAASPETPAAAATGALAVLGSPTVSAVSPASGPTAGGTQVEVLGSGFGTVLGDQLFVRFGGVLSTNVSLVSDSQLFAVVPPGVGAGVGVTVQTRSSQLSPAVPLFSYAAPEVISAEPQYGFVGQSSLDVVVTGRNFGNSRSDITSLTVSGVQCPVAGIEWLGSATLRCTGLVGTGLSSTDAKVVVTVGGSASAPNAAFSALPAPIVSRLSPSVAPAGSEVTLVGDFFGRTAEDVVSITIGGAACPHLPQLHSPGSIACVVPTPSESLLQQADAGDTSVLTGLPVVVVTRGGLASSATTAAGATFSYPGFEDFPWAAAIGGVGFRPVGERSTLLLRWLFPVAALDGIGPGGAPISSFALRYSTDRAALLATLSAATLPDSATTVAELSILRAALQRVQVLPGAEWALVSARHFGLTSAPQHIAVAPVNARGRGSWAVLQSAIYEECLPGSYLRDKAETAAEQVCTPCPEGAFCPGSGGSAGVLGRVGFWRIPWTKEGLGFMVCPRASSCAGISEAAAADLAAVSANRDTSRAPAAESAVDVLSHLASAAPDALVAARNATGSSRYPPLPVGVLTPGGRVNTSVVVTVDVTSAITQGLTVASALLDTANHPLPSVFSDPQALVPASLDMLQGARPSPNAAAAPSTSTAPSGPARRAQGNDQELHHVDRSLQSGRAALTADEVAAEAAQLGMSATELETILGGEGCDEGYKGVACASCAAGYAPQGSFQCSLCPEPAVSTSLGLLLGVLVTGVVCLLVYRTLQNGGAEGRLESAAVKVLFTHLQTIAITAALPLQWPEGALAMFDLASATTTISAESFSVDCGLDGGSAPGESRFFSRSILILFVPVMCIVGGAVLWTFQAWLCPARSTTIARRLSKGQLVGGGSKSLGSSPRLDPTSVATSINPLLTLGAPAKSSSPSPSKPSDSKELARRSTVKSKGWKRVARAVSAATEGGNAAAAPTSDAAVLGLTHLSLLASSSAAPRSTFALAAAVLEARRLDRFAATARKPPPTPCQVAFSRWVVSTIIILFLLHTTLVRTALQIFTCVPVVAAGVAAAPASSASDGYRALQADMSVDCASAPAQMMMAAVGWPALVVYAVGIPLGGACVLWRQRHSLTASSTRALYGFLYAGFKPQWYFWESIIMLRKVGIAVCSVLMAPLGLETQTYCALALVVVAVTIHARAWPYTKAFLNSLELLSLLTAAVTLFSALFLLSAQGRIAEAAVTGANVSADLGTVEVATVVLVVTNATFLAVAILAIGNAVWQGQPDSARLPRLLRGLRGRVARSALAACCTTDGRPRIAACCTKPAPALRASDNATGTGASASRPELYQIRKATSGPAVTDRGKLYAPDEAAEAAAKAAIEVAALARAVSGTRLISPALAGASQDGSSALAAAPTAAKLGSVMSMRGLGKAADPARVRA